MALERPCGVDDLPFESVVPLENLLAPLEVDLTGLREPAGTRGPVDELHAELFLEGADALGCRGLRDSVQRGGAEKLPSWATSQNKRIVVRDITAKVQ